LALLNGTYEGAELRFKTTLEQMTGLGDAYGRLQALTSLCDANLAMAGQAAASSEETHRERMRAAAGWLEQAVDLTRSLGDRVGETPLCNRLALIYERLESHDQALATHERTLELAQQLGSRRAAATAWMCIGQWRQRREQPQEAITAFRQCVELADESAKAAALYALAEAQRGAGQLAEALVSFQAAYQLIEQTTDLASQLQCLRAIAEAQRALGQRDAALKTLGHAIDVAHALEAPVENDLKKLLEEWRK
jgi:tetratricopeptide (TPR) repeat protein